MRRALTLCVIVGLVCVVAQAALHFLDMWVWDWRYSAFDAGSGESIFEEVGTVASFVAATAVWALAVAGGRDRAALAVLGVLMTFVAADNAVTLHAGLGRYWPLLYLPILAPAGALLWRLARRSPVEPGRFIRIALVLLVLSVFGEKVMGAVLSRLGQAPGDTIYELKVVAAQSCELVGWILLASGLAAIAATTIASRTRYAAKDQALPSSRPESHPGLPAGAAPP